jgi:hypothetical protein
MSFRWRAARCVARTISIVTAARVGLRQSPHSLFDRQAITVVDRRDGASLRQLTNEPARQLQYPVPPATYADRSRRSDVRQIFVFDARPLTPWKRFRVSGRHVAFPRRPIPHVASARDYGHFGVVAASGSIRSTASRRFVANGVFPRGSRMANGWFSLRSPRPATECRSCGEPNSDRRPATGVTRLIPDSG